MSMLGRLFKRKKRDNQGRILGDVIDKRIDGDFEGLTVTIRPREVNLFYDPPPDIGFWSDNKLYETSTLNEIREMAGMEPVKSEDTEKRKRCEYCGCVSDRDYGTCAHCGAPL